MALLAVGFFGARALFRMAENNFWSLNSLAVEPVYVACREGLRHLVEKLLQSRLDEFQLATLRAGTAGAAGIVIFAIALAVMIAVLAEHALAGHCYRSRFATRVNSGCTGQQHRARHRLPCSGLHWSGRWRTRPCLDWSILARFLYRPATSRTWRVAHLSDVHVVGERYGFRIESGRAGPRGNQRLHRLLAKLDAIHADDPIDTILITGDLTDAGRSTEWSELLDALADYPRLADRIVVLPGNHDLNIVDRSNPARLDLPTSPSRTLRRLRFLSAANALHGGRVRLIDQAGRCLAGNLSEALKPHLKEMDRFSETGRPWLSRTLSELWAESFPMVLPPDQADGLGIILLNSNADTHFSFTNALGMISIEQVRGIEIAAEQYPQARWIIALHHHVIEYPMAAKVLSERIGTSWSTETGLFGGCNRWEAGQWSCTVTGTLTGSENVPVFRSCRRPLGDGSDRRRGYLFLHPYAGSASRRAPRLATSGAGHCGQPT